MKLNRMTGCNERLPPVVPALPPAVRSRVAMGLTTAAAVGEFELQVCSRCKAVQYPPRETCHQCLSDNLLWKRQSGDGELIACTVLHHSHDAYFRERLPWSIGTVKLDCGPTVVVHLPDAAPKPPARVRVSVRLDRAGMGVLVMTASKTGTSADLNNDRRLQELACAPKGCNVLVTNGSSLHAQATVQALLSAGAERIWVGMPEPDKEHLKIGVLRESPRVLCVPLNVADDSSVKQLADDIGGDVNIVINTVEANASLSALPLEESARREMEVNYFGLLNLGRHFGPIMLTRAADGEAKLAWVNVLSIFSLVTLPTHSTYSASMAAAHSLSQGLRTDLGRFGVRVINVFPGPFDDVRSHSLPEPKLAPTALADAIVTALHDGVEDIYPGELASEWRDRLREDPKTLERQLTRSSGR